MRVGISLIPSPKKRFIEPIRLKMATDMKVIIPSRKKKSRQKMVVERGGGGGRERETSNKPAID